MKYLENKPNFKEFNELLESVGWGNRREDVLEISFQNTIYCVSVYDEDKFIGFARLIGDISLFIYIQDVIVTPDYQGKGIGKKIMETLLEKIDKLKEFNPNIRVYLGSASVEKQGFYKKFGFITRLENGLGQAMILK